MFISLTNPITSCPFFGGGMHGVGGVSVFLTQISQVFYHASHDAVVGRVIIYRQVFTSEYDGTAKARVLCMQIITSRRTTHSQRIMCASSPTVGFLQTKQFAGTLKKINGIVFVTTVVIYFLEFN